LTFFSSKIFTGLISSGAALIILGLFVLFTIPVSIYFEINHFVVSSLALSGGYLLTSGIQMYRDWLERAIKFLENTRQDSAFQKASEKTWEVLRRRSELGADDGFAYVYENERDYLNDIAIVADLYEEMATMINNNLANENLLYDYYGNPLVRFFGGFREEIQKFRSVRVELSDGTELTTEEEYVQIERLYPRWLDKHNQVIEKMRLTEGTAGSKK